MTLPERPKDNPANRPETVTSESMRDDIQRFVHSKGNMTDIIKKFSDPSLDSLRPRFLSS